MYINKNEHKDVMSDQKCVGTLGVIVRTMRTNMLLVYISEYM